MQVPRDWEMGEQIGWQRLGLGAPSGSGWHSGPPTQNLSVVAAGSYSTSPAKVGSLLVVTTPATGGQSASLNGGGSIDQTFVIAPLPVQVHLDGTPGTLIVSWQIPNGQTVSAAITIVGSQEGACQAHPELCAKAALPCTSPQVMDSISGSCVSPCWDGSVPANGVCPAHTTTAAAPASSVSGATIAAVGLGAVGLIAAVWYFA